MFDPSLRERLLSALQQLADSDAPEARLLIEAGPVYLMWIATPNAEELEHESVSSSALPELYKLSSERGKILRELGFAKRSGRRNWKRRHGRDRASLERAADETLDILARVYGADEAPTLALELDDAAHPQNPELITAIRKVAKGWDEAIRRAMYTELLNATLLVPVDPAHDEDAEGSEVFFDFETHESGRPTLGVFTDWASLRLWRPRGHAYWPIHGSLLFEMALERNPISVRVNPEGDIGGELYAHEVEMLVRAVHAHRSKYGA